MRHNAPVTHREHELAEGVTLMSTTDMDSRITFANEAFVQVSGFSRDELLAQPHNLVRHPDMPEQAFADMWKTLKAGHAWSALVKNRRANGDHYWVRANATPVSRNGHMVGYMSVRTRPEREEVASADALYRDFREGRAKGLRFHQGLVIRRGWLSWMSWHRRLPVAWQLRLALFWVALAGMVGLGAALPSAGEALAWSGLPLLALVAMVGVLEQWVIRPLLEVLHQAQQVATGAPAEFAQQRRVDEIGRLQRSIQQAGLNLKCLLDDVQARAQQVSEASREIAAGNDDLSARTEQAAANLQETAASLDEFGGSIRHNADSAQRAVLQADAARGATVQGRAAVHSVVGTMQAISQSSKRMADIIGVIDGIAFQTNILALNAAVEAARAGEQGRGFAVVAGEVRTLAQRSATAAQEIRLLIEEGRRGVETGVNLVDTAGETLEDSQRQVTEVSALIKDIGSVTAEQASNVAEVNVAVSRLDQMTQQNAALVEQIAAASHSLEHEALRLRETIGAFA
jgi:aerotaxis receptor